MADDPRCSDPTETCLYDCDYVFGAPTVLPFPRGGTVVQWELNAAVRDLGVYTYTLQTGNAEVTDADAWEDVITDADAFYLVDPHRWDSGVYRFKYYRIKLTTGERTYYSRPLHTQGKLTYADWRLYLSVLRAEEVQLRGRSGIDGIIFKRKVSGTPCTRCRDYNTGEVTDGGCKVCYGNGWVGGYYAAVHCCWFQVDPANRTITHDVETQGAIMADTSVAARAVAVPMLATGDIWVNKQSGERYKIIQLQDIVEVKGVPVVYRVAMDRLPVSDVVYRLPIL
jgi:hypothetical protein